MKSELFKAQFGNQFRDDLKERLVYSSDLGELPSTVRNLVNTTPDGSQLGSGLSYSRIDLFFCLETRHLLVPPCYIR